MVNDNKKGFLQRTASKLGFTADAPSEVRSELPVTVSPNLPRSARNLSFPSPDPVSPDRAIGLASVYRAVSIIGTSVSQLPVGVWRGGEELELASTSLVNRPNLSMSRSAFFEQTAVSLAVSGSAYWLLKGKTSPTGAVQELEVLNPHTTVITYKDGKKVYESDGKTYPEWKVKQLWLNRLPGYEYGIGPIQAAQNELRGLLDQRNYADNWFREGGVPSGVLSNKQQMSPGEAARAKEAFDTNQSERGRGVVALSGDWSYQPTYLSPKDALFIESQQYGRTQIAMIFGIPATYMLAGVEGNSMTYTNLEMVDTQFVRYTLMKYLKEIEEALSDLLPRGQEARFKVDVLLRADTKTRYESYKVGIDAGFLKVNEAREIEGRLPLSAAELKAAKPAPAPAVNQNGNGSAVNDAGN